MLTFDVGCLKVKSFPVRTQINCTIRYSMQDAHEGFHREYLFNEKFTIMMLFACFHEQLFPFHTLVGGNKKDVHQGLNELIINEYLGSNLVNS
jgi:hypothetical protein